MTRRNKATDEDVLTLYNFRRQELVPLELQRAVTPEEYEAARRRLSSDILRRPIYSPKRKMYGQEISDAIKNLEELRKVDNLGRKASGLSVRGHPLSEIMCGLIDHALVPGARFIHAPFAQIELVSGSEAKLFNQLYGVLGELLFHFLAPEARAGERAALSPGKIHSDEPLDDALPIDITPVDEDMDTPDTGDSIETFPSQAEVDAIRFRNTLETERATAADCTAGLLSGYPKEIIDLAYAMGEHGQIQHWAHEYGVPGGTAWRWAKELREEIQGAHKMYPGYWEDVSARCRKTYAKAHPASPHGQWVAGERTDAQSRITVRGFFYSGEMSSGEFILDKDVAAVYYAELRR